MKKYEFLDHPADIKLRAFGSNLAELFINAALGMMEFLYGDIFDVRVADADCETMEVTANDAESLLVNWLAEILFLSDTKHRAYIKYQVREINEQKIVATAGFVSATAKDDIKAVTYHELQIIKNENEVDGKEVWVATVVFDI